MKLKTPEINAELTLFCPSYHKSDNKLTKDGVYITRNDPIPRQMFYCFLKQVIARYLANKAVLKSMSKSPS